MEPTLGYRPPIAGYLTGIEISGTVPGGQFDWGGRLRKSNGGVQRFPQRGRKSREEHNSNEDYNSMVYSRTGYGCSADNRTLYIIVIDKSTDPDYGRSAGCNTATMCQLAAHYGCSNLANFDAGGSAQMMVEGRVANKTTESSPRKLANGLMVFSTAAAGTGATIAPDSGSDAEEWYTLDGIRLDARPAEKGIYLLRQGSRTQKIAVK